MSIDTQHIQAATLERTGPVAPTNASEMNHALPLTLIEPRPGWKALDLRELWQYRELLYFLTWRDVKVRYKQTALGVAWAIIQPFMMMVVFTIFLGRIAKVPSGDFPYPVFVYAGLLPWRFFATALTNASNSVVGSERLIAKVYLPRLVIPFASVGAALVDFVVAFSVLVLLMIYYGIKPAMSLLLVPGLLALAMLAALGVGTLLAALNVAYRDFRYVIPFLVQLWMFATPSIYMQPIKTEQADPPTVTLSARSDIAAGGEQSHSKARSAGQIPDTVRWLLHLNPMTGLIEFFRAATLGGSLPWQQLGISTLPIVAFFPVGCFYFRRVEDSFADII